MSAEKILLRLFWIVDSALADVKKRSGAHLYPSEVVTIGLLFALKGGKYRPLYRWLDQISAPGFRIFQNSHGYSGCCVIIVAILTAS